jgi:hypothetical protein
MELWNWLFGKRDSGSVSAPAPQKAAVAPQTPRPAATRQPSVGSTNWRISPIERHLLDGWIAGNVFPVASGATATWQGSGTPPMSIDADVTIKCPACKQALPIHLTSVLTENLDNAQKLSVAPCPACRRCSVLVQGLVRSNESPTAIHFIATMNAAEANSVLVDPSLSLISIADGPARASLPSLQDTSAHPNVIFDKKDVVDLMGTVCTYHVYKAPTKAEAVAFLKDQTVERENVYITVNTPEGSPTRSKKGIH